MHYPSVRSRSLVGFPLNGVAAQLSHKSRTTKLLEFYRLLHPFRVTNAYGVFPKNTVAPFR